MYIGRRGAVAKIQNPDNKNICAFVRIAGRVGLKLTLKQLARLLYCRPSQLTVWKVQKPLSLAARRAISARIPDEPPVYIQGDLADMLPYKGKPVTPYLPEC